MNAVLTVKMALLWGGCFPLSGQATPPSKRPELSRERVKIEVLHSPADCEAYQTKPVCAESSHWRILVDDVERPPGERLRYALRKEAEREPNPLEPGLSKRKVLIWGAGRAPYGIVQRILDACQGAGLYRIDISGEKSHAELLPPSRPQPAPQEPEEVTLAVQWKDGTLKRSVDKGEFLAGDRDLLERLLATGADSSTPVIMRPEKDIPWSEILHLMDLCKSVKLDCIEFVAEGPWPPIPPEWGKATEDEITALAQSIDQAAAKGNLEVWDETTARDEMLRRIVGPAKLSDPLSRLVNSVFDEMILSQKQLQPPAPDTPALKFLRLRKTDGGARPLFRVLTANRLDYVELVIAKSSEGDVCIVDLCSMQGGDLQTKIVRELLIPDAGTLDILNQLKAPTPIDLAVGGALGEMTALIFEKKHREALALFEKKSRLMIPQKRAWRTYVNTARLVDEDAYVKAVREMEKALPEDPGLPLLRIDAFVISKEYDKALEAIDALDRWVEGDPYLNSLRDELKRRK